MLKTVKSRQQVRKRHEEVRCWNVDRMALGKKSGCGVINWRHLKYHEDPIFTIREHWTVNIDICSKQNDGSIIGKKPAKPKRFECELLGFTTNNDFKRSCCKSHFRAPSAKFITPIRCLVLLQSWWSCCIIAVHSASQSQGHSVGLVYSCPNPSVSSMAKPSFSTSCS